ncbi:hypothetical protein [Hymenobacter sp. BT190]|uniref:hypothetical protein n=1 Tax=Hymenobacter sp. BT190 TaxID=2763505 RepID=UPI0016519D62|nr:hypothetical protein [Hymenobacter sp. BT190]MBC6699459.1 hypothetical protein [Hymenobacter sp. BT190]
MSHTLVRRHTYAKALFGILMLLATLLALRYLPVLQNPAPPAAVAHGIPLVVRHAPRPIVHHVGRVAE